MARRDLTIVWSADLQKQIERAAGVPLDKAVGIVAEGMKRRIPKSEVGSNGRPPGYAASRIRQLKRGRDDQGLFRDVGTDARTKGRGGYCYPIGLEYGTKPHIIRSKGDWPLRDGRGKVFGREVKHPGTRPYPWARPSAMLLNGKRL